MAGVEAGFILMRAGGLCCSAVVGWHLACTYVLCLNRPPVLLDVNGTRCT